MTHTEDELRTTLGEAIDMPIGQVKEALLEDVLRHAEAAELARVAFDTRLVMINAYSGGSTPAKMFTPFARCLADWDRERSAYQPWVGHRLLWAFKHTVTAMLRYPEVPLDRVYAALDDMERRYQDGGHSMHAVYTHRHMVAMHVGDTAAADEWFEKWTAVPRDQLSDCVGCEPTTKVHYLAARGRDAEATALAEPVLAGTLTCREQPHTILTELLLPYTRTDRYDRARAAHLRAYRTLRIQPHELATIADHIQFCARAGNEARGLELLERHIGWLDLPRSPSSIMEFAGAGSLLLRRVAETGHETLTVRRPAAGTRQAAEVPVAELAAELAQQALAVAARFDARNGSTARTDHVREVLAAQPVADHVPLAMTRTRPVTPPAVETDVPVAELVERAEYLMARQESDRVAPLLHRFAGDLDPALAARVTVLRARSATDVDEQQAGLRSAADQFAALGDQRREHLALGRLGASLCRGGQVEAGMALLHAAEHHFLAEGDDVDLAWNLLRQVDALVMTDRFGEAFPVLDRAQECAERGGDNLAIGVAIANRVDVLWARQDYDPAQLLALLDRAIQAFQAADGGVQIAAAYQRIIALRRQTGENDLALDAAREAARVIPAGAPVAARASVHLQYGRALVAVDRHAEALSEFTEAALLATEAGEPTLAAESRFALAHTYRAVGQSLDAMDVAEEALTGYQRAGDEIAADRCRFLLAETHVALNEPELALLRYDEIATRTGERGEYLPSADALIAAADLMDRLDRDQLAADAYHEGGERAAQGGDRFRVAYCRYQEAMSLMWSGRIEDAVRVHESAEAVVAALPSDRLRTWHSAQCAMSGARVLRAAGRLADAVEKASLAVSSFTECQAVERLPGARLTLGQLLVEADRAAEAEPVLRSAYETLSSRGPHRGAASALAAALDRLGRGDEAAAVRAEGGVESG
ncbi:MAG TPA: tetratricopeptide repeat protein [Pseudonocardiaceae bacterium]